MIPCQYKLQNQHKIGSTQKLNLNINLKIIFEQILIIVTIIIFFLPVQFTVFGDETDSDVPKWLSDKYEISNPISLIPQKNLEGWTAHNGKEPDKNNWSVENGKLTCNGTKNNHLNGDLVTKKEYENFILDFEWINSKSGNSGIKYKLKDFGEIGGIINHNDKFCWLGCEYQILDDANHAEGTKNKYKNSAAALYSILAPDKNKKLNPHNKTNTGKIIVANEHVEHWLNGEKVLEYNINTPEWKAAFAKCKYAKAENFAQNKKGLIMLQDHGNKIIFTKLTIREIKKK
ncbi:MAG: DUF1080 domain-containing protein [Planctomycetaceae bacterium]|jgi:hypothetical protein|nr:DUF1080 domain-containing protein [Planctomycetaceae bacterium]